jgi:anti-sigma B factor antagonist
MPLPPTLHVEEIQLSSRLVVLAAEGELDIATADALRDPVEESLESAGAVILELSALEFIDSVGIWTLVQLCQRAQRSGRRFAVVHGPHEQVERVIELTGLDRHVPIFSSLELALESLGPSSYR